MDAALIVVYSGGRLYVAGLRRPRGEHVRRRQLLTLGRLDGVARRLVESGDYPAAELRDFGEGVNLTTVVNLGQSLPDLYRQIGWHESPRSDLLRRAELAVELREGRRARPAAGSDAQRRVEGCRVTVVLNADVGAGHRRRVTAGDG